MLFPHRGDVWPDLRHVQFFEDPDSLKPRLDGPMDFHSFTYLRLIDLPASTSIDAIQNIKLVQQVEPRPSTGYTHPVEAVEALLLLHDGFLLLHPQREIFNEGPK